MDHSKPRRPFLTYKTAEEETGLSHSTIKRLVAAGRIKSVKIMTNRRLEGESYEQFLAELRAKAA